MHNRMIVTITDVHGSRHYTLPRVARRLLLILLVAMVVALTVGSLYILVVNRQVTALEQRRDELAAEHYRLEQENQTLAARISTRNEQLEVASTRLISLNRQVDDMADDMADIESLIGLRPMPAVALRRRLDLASLTAHQKQMLLASVPSGYPIHGSYITSGFGMRQDPVGGRKRYHYGTDIFADVGTPVYATADGIVEFSGFDAGSGYGNLLVLVHDFGFKTYYGHLDEIQVQEGEFVEQGQLVALSGKSGRVTGPHLHYEVRRLERKLNPRPFMDWSLARYDALFDKETNVPWESLAQAIKRRVGPVPPQLSQRALASTVN